MDRGRFGHGSPRGSGAAAPQDGDPLVIERFDPGPPVGQAGWSSSWMRAASCKSLSVSGLGCVGDLVHERDRVGEVLAHEGLEDLVAAPLPTGQALQALLDRGV